MSIFEEKLASIKHYRNYPAMLPFIGKNYVNDSGSRLLLVGESNYLPHNSVIHLDAEKWYKNNQKDLSKEEIEWIHCRNILNTEWNNGGHRIYKELNAHLSSKFNDQNLRGMDYVSYMNAFQRPARQGDSIKHIVNKIDIEKSYEVLKDVIKTLKPNKTIFVSKYAWDKLGSKLNNTLHDYDINFVCHPGTGGRYWHNPKYPNGVNKFKHLIQDL